MPPHAARPLAWVAILLLLIAATVSHAEGVYFTDDSAIHRIDLAGGGLETVLRGFRTPRLMAIDPGAGKLYVGNILGRVIQRMNLDGTDVVDLVETGAVWGVALDLVNSKLYWTETDTARIQRANLDGTLVEPVVAGLSEPRGIAVDPVAGKIYWADRGTDSVHRANLDGSSPETLWSGLLNPLGVALGPLVSGNRTLLYSDFDAPVGTTVYLGNLTTLASTPVHAVGGQAIIDGVGFSTLGAGGATLGTLYTAVQRNLGMTSTVEACPLGTTSCGAVTALANGLFDPVGLAVDAAAQKIYWNDNSTMRIERASAIDGSLRETLIGQATGAQGIAVDRVSGRVYWTGGAIHRADLDGANRVALVDPASGAEGIALDPNGGKVYWADSDTNEVLRADLDGSNVEVVVTGETDVHDVALDVDGGRIYWVGPNLSQVRRANLDGSGVQNVVATTGIPVGLAIHGASCSLFYKQLAFSVVGEIRRTNFAGSFDSLVVTGLALPFGWTWGLDLEPVTVRLLWTDDPGSPTDGTIGNALWDGSLVSNLQTGLGLPQDVAALGPPFAGFVDEFEEGVVGLGTTGPGLGGAVSATRAGLSTAGVLGGWRRVTVQANPGTTSQAQALQLRSCSALDSLFFGVPTGGASLEVLWDLDQATAEPDVADFASYASPAVLRLTVSSAPAPVTGTVFVEDADGTSGSIARTIAAPGDHDFPLAGVAGLDLSRIERVSLTLSTQNAGTFALDEVLVVAAPPGDADADGVPDAVEDSAPNGGDGNGDGIADSAQPAVTSLPDDGTSYVTVSVSGPGCGVVEGVSVEPESTQPVQDPLFDYPFGLVGFHVPCPAATVTLFFHGVAALGPPYRKFDGATYSTLAGAIFGSQNVGGVPTATVTLSLFDGGPGDLVPGDGAITDPGGVTDASLPGLPVLSPLAAALLAGLLAAGSALVVRSARASSAA